MLRNSRYVWVQPNFPVVYHPVNERLGTAPMSDACMKSQWVKTSDEQVHARIRIYRTDIKFDFALTTDLRRPSRLRGIMRFTASEVRTHSSPDFTQQDFNLGSNMREFAC